MRARDIKPDTIVFNYVIQNMARAKHLDDAVRYVLFFFCCFLILLCINNNVNAEW